MPFDVTISRETVAHWIDVPFKILARIFDDDDCELEEWEKEIWIPAVQGVLNRYLPEFLRMTDKPELAMLGIAAATYCGMRARIFFRRKKAGRAWFCGTGNG